jgi:DNA repair exonuclease SbcCD ATPase subunit
LKLGQTTITLVDTPGFDDTNQTETKILRHLSSWLSDSYKDGRKINAIFYLHRITDQKMSGGATRNLRSFKKLCGPQCYANIILGTTFWSRANRNNAELARAERREQELRTSDSFWKEMVDGGSMMVRIPGTTVEARELLLDLCNREPQVLEAQVEQVDQNKPFEELAAVRSINPEISRMQQEQANRLRERQRQHEQEIATAAKRLRVETKRLADKLRQEEEEERRLAEQRWRDERKERDRLRDLLAAIKAKQQRQEKEHRELEERLAKFKQEEDKRRKVEQERLERLQAEQLRQRLNSHSRTSMMPKGGMGLVSRLKADSVPFVLTIS